MSIIDDDKFNTKSTGIFDEIIFELVNTFELRKKEIAFTMGGHHYVYPLLIPENKIFIDNRMCKDDIIASLIHEFVERVFMKFYGTGYEDSHKMSNEIEVVVRKIMNEKLEELPKEFSKGRTDVKFE